MSQEHRQQRENHTEHRPARSFLALLAMVSSLMLSGLGLAQTELTRDEAIKAAENTSNVLAPRLAAAEAQIATAGLPGIGNRTGTGGYTLAGSDPAPLSGTDQNSWNLNAILNLARLRGRANDARGNALPNFERARQ